MTRVGRMYHVLDGRPDPTRSKGNFFGGRDVAAHCKVMGHSTVSCAKTAEPIDKPFWTKTRVNPKEPRCEMGYRSPNAKGQFSGVVRATQKDWQSSVQSLLQRCCRVRCKRDHSVCQASANRNPENSELRQCGLSAGKGVMGGHRAGEVWYLRLHCCAVVQQLTRVQLTEHVAVPLW